MACHAEIRIAQKRNEIATTRYPALTSVLIKPANVLVLGAKLILTVLTTTLTGFVQLNSAYTWPRPLPAAGPRWTNPAHSFQLDA